MNDRDMSRAAVSARLREVARLSDLRVEHRLATKVDMSPHGVSKRLHTVEQALALCRKLAARP